MKEGNVTTKTSASELTDSQRKVLRTIATATATDLKFSIEMMAGVGNPGVKARFVPFITRLTKLADELRALEE